MAVIPLESLLDRAQTEKFWPQRLIADASFARQVQQRRELNEIVRSATANLPRPDMPLEIAIDSGHISRAQAAALYKSLGLLLKDKDYRRLVLYLPFEFLPDQAWHTPDKELKLIRKRFKKIYMKAWTRMLWVHDVAANFIDGDVPEPECRVGELPRVVKAAHLIPVLIAKGLLEYKDVAQITQQIDDQVLKESIEQAFGAKISPALKPALMTPKRAAWLQQLEEEETMDDLARNIGAAILENGLTKESIWRLRENPDTREALSWALYRLYHSGDVSRELLDELNIAIPALAGPFSKNLVLIRELPAIQRMAASITTDLDLSRLIYPVVLLFGSRLNGYGRENSDIDLAIFVRPETSIQSRLALHELLKKTFTQVMVNETLEFWLDYKASQGQLTVREFAQTETDMLIAEGYWTHILFGAAWLGDENAIRELFEKLLLQYMRNSEKRCVYLENVEQSTLQYRLMHKGYARFFSPCGIAGDSVFWDSGYRQLATKIFVSRVFLPKIPGK